MKSSTVSSLHCSIFVAASIAAPTHTDTMIALAIASVFLGCYLGDKVVEMWRVGNEKVR